jgi:hypothetical protein
MSSNVRITQSLDFLRARADGRADMEAAKSLLAGVAAAAAPRIEVPPCSGRCGMPSGVYQGQAH